MKRLIIPAVLAVSVLASCSSKDKSPEDYITSDNLVLHSSTDIEDNQTSTTPFEITTAADDTAPRFSYALNGTTVELSYGDTIVKTLEYYYTPDAASIAVADYNFDGYDDIYIPYEYPTNCGYYYCFDPTKNTFTENKELNSIGRSMTVSGENQLAEQNDDGYIDRTIEYEWSNGKLKPVRKIEVYTSVVDNLTHTDIYKYDSSGAEYLDEAR